MKVTVAEYTYVNNVVFAKRGEEVAQILQVSDILWERNYIFLEAWYSSVESASTLEVTYTDLHVVQRYEHGFDDCGIPRKV